VNYANNREGTEKVAKDIAAAGGKATVAQGSVAKAEDVERIFATAAIAYGIGLKRRFSSYVRRGLFACDEFTQHKAVNRRRDEVTWRCSLRLGASGHDLLRLARI
jgi:hypothetical protein